METPPQAVTVRHELPERGSSLTTPGRLSDRDHCWIRLPGHVDWKEALGAITVGPMTRVLWANMTSDMLVADLTIEIIRRGTPQGMKAV